MATTVEFYGPNKDGVMVSLDNGLTEYPLLDERGQVLWAEPNKVPKFAKEQAAQMLKQLHYKACVDALIRGNMYVAGSQGYAQRLGTKFAVTLTFNDAEDAINLVYSNTKTFPIIGSF